MWEFVKEYLAPGIVTLVTSIGTFIVGRRLSNAEVKKTEGDALKTVQEVYDKFSSDMMAKYVELRAEVVSLTEDLKTLRTNQLHIQGELDDCRKGILKK
jgi:uncharacterized protein YacL (UPF0231 family)